jgi:hypothetical protein
MKTAIDIGRRSDILATAAVASKETQWKAVAANPSQGARWYSGALA